MLSQIQLKGWVGAKPRLGKGRGGCLQWAQGGVAGRGWLPDHSIPNKGSGPELGVGGVRETKIHIRSPPTISACPGQSTPVPPPLLSSHSSPTPPPCSILDPLGAPASGSPGPGQGL